MAHPSRAHLFPYLSRMLGDVKFSIDEKSEGPWPNAKRAWSMRDPEAKYHVVVQDDAIVCENFEKRASEFIVKMENIFPKEKLAFSFYYGRRSENEKHAKIGMANGFVASRWVSWGVAICMPTDAVEKMIEFCGKYTIKNDDTRIANFLKFHDYKICFPMPSLIDHRHDEKSLVGDGGGRRAWYFIDNVKK